MATWHGELDRLGLVKSRRGGRILDTQTESPPTHGGDQVNYSTGSLDPAKLEARYMFLPAILPNARPYHRRQSSTPSLDQAVAFAIKVISPPWPLRPRFCRFPAVNSTERGSCKSLARRIPGHDGFRVCQLGSSNQRWGSGRTRRPEQSCLGTTGIRARGSCSPSPSRPVAVVPSLSPLHAIRAEHCTMSLVYHNSPP